MESILPVWLQVALLGVLAIGFGLSRIARSWPDVAWLQAFRLPTVQMTEEEKARRRRAGNRQAGLEIIVAGLALPVLYMISTVMMFNNFKTLPTIIVNACSVLCIALGIWVFVRNR